MRRLRAWFLRLGGFFAKDRRDEELRAEIESHLALHEEDNRRAGMPPQEAHRQAVIKLGGITPMAEAYRDRRGLPWLETLWQDIRFGVRMLKKSPGATAAAIIALALGIGANTAIFSVVNAVLLHPLPYPDASKLMSVTSFIPKYNQTIVVHPDYFGWRAQNHVFEDAAAMTSADYTLTGAGEPTRLDAESVSASMFHVLGIQPMIGRGFSADEDKPNGPHVTILSYALWKERFGGDRGVIGKVIALDGNAYTVVGILPREFEIPQHSKAQLLTPLALEDSPVQLNQRLMMVGVIARLRPKMTPALAVADLNPISEHLHASYPGGYARMLSGSQMRVISLHDREVGDVRPAVLVLLGAVCFVLLIACANVANLQLARAVTREKEIALRGALGAGRWRLTRQLLTESGFIALVGGATGLLLAVWVLRIVRALGPRTIPHLANAQLDLRVLLFTLGVSLATGMLFGMAPAFAAMRVPINHTLKEGGAQSGSAGGARRSQKIFTVAEVSLALVLFIGAGLLMRSLLLLISLPLGFDPQNVLTAQISLPLNSYKEPEQQRAFFSELIQRVETLPGVTAAGAADGLPVSGFVEGSVLTVEGHAAPDAGTLVTEANAVFITDVSPGYLSALRISLISGRLLDRRDVANAPRSLMVNQALVRRYFTDENPLGARVKLADGDWWTVVGVLQDVRQSLAGEVSPAVYLPFEQSPFPRMSLVIRSQVPPESLARAVREQVEAIDKDLPVYEVETMDSVMAGETASQKFNAYLLGFFAGLAVLLAAVGIYGVMAYAVSQRTREIGIRMALGAAPSQVRGMMLRQGMWLTLMGIMCGLAASFALTRLMRNLLYGIKPTDPVTFAGVSAILLVVAMVACWIPARRATRVNPTIALRYE
jgi:predicted permease